MLRRQYFELGLEAIRHGRLPWLVQQATKLVSIPLSDALDRTPPGPILGGLILTYHCNNACQMCEFPQRATRFHKAGRRQLSTERYRELIGEFAQLGTTGLSLIGGEPTLRRDLNELLVEIKRLGMIANITTNANRLANEDTARKLLETHVDLINVSIDGADAATHDRVRGAPGSFEKLSKGIRQLARLRDRISPSTRIASVTVLSSANIGQAEDIARLALALGCDSVGFMPLHRFDFMGDALEPADTRWLEEADRVVEQLRKKRRQYRLDSSDAYLSRFGAAFRGAPSDLRCLAGFYSLTVNPYGDVFPCDPFVGQERALGNVRDASLVELWRSKEYGQKRRELTGCRACHWNCTTELNIAFDRLVPLRRTPRAVR